MQDDNKYIKIALDKARESVEKGGFPAGAIIVKDGHVVAEGLSLGFSNNDPTGHAESVGIREACVRLGTPDLSGCTLYASLTPCLMCFSSAAWANISRIVYATKKTPEMIEKMYYEGTTDILEVNKNNNHKMELVYIDGFEEESLALLASWEDSLQK